MGSGCSSRLFSWFVSERISMLFERISMRISGLLFETCKNRIYSEFSNCGSSNTVCFHASYHSLGESFLLSLVISDALAQNSDGWGCSGMKSFLLCGMVGVSCIKRRLQHRCCVAIAV